MGVLKIWVISALVQLLRKLILIVLFQCLKSKQAEQSKQVLKGIIQQSQKYLRLNYFLNVLAIAI